MKPITIVVPPGTELNIIKEEEQIKEMPLPTMEKTKILRFIYNVNFYEITAFFDIDGKLVFVIENMFMELFDNLDPSYHYKFENISDLYDIDLITSYFEKKTPKNLTDLEFALN
jgi:hypothetical protein